MNTFPNAEEFKEEIITSLDDFIDNQNPTNRQPIRDWFDDFALWINQKWPSEVKTT